MSGNTTVRPLCPKGRHTILSYREMGQVVLECRDCTLRVGRRELVAARSSQEALRRAERDIAIQELES